MNSGICERRKMNPLVTIILFTFSLYFIASSRSFSLVVTFLFPSNILFENLINKTSIITVKIKNSTLFMKLLIQLRTGNKSHLRAKDVVLLIDLSQTLIPYLSSGKYTVIKLYQSVAEYSKILNELRLQLKKTTNE